MPMWIVNKLLIGDCDHYAKNNVTMQKIQLDKRYGKLRQHSKVEVQNFLTKVENVEVKNALTGTLPVHPTYCFNTDAPEMRGLGVNQWPENDIHIAIHFVGYFNLEGDSSIVFPTHLQLTIEKDDTVTTISKHLDEELKKTKVSTTTETESHQRLFERPLKDKWNYQLWILPQKDGARKMFRYHEGRLTSFLNAEKVEEGGTRLYIEAHIVPKGKIGPLSVEQ